MEIQGKVAIITGASNGIGLAAARLFAQQGAKVALVARSTDKLSALATELPGSLAVTADMSNETDVQRMIKQVHKHYGRIDILVNNAGRGMHVPIEHASLQDYRNIFELNVVGVLCAMQAVIPIMRQQRDGVIINISSGLSKRIVPGVGPYASTKYALNAITLTARQELAADNIRVGLMIPGLTGTDFGKNAIRLPQATFDRARMMQADTAEHVAEKILEAVQTEAPEVYADSIKPA